MSKIKFGTDGWRAIIAKDFTVENVARVTEATSKWLKNNNSDSTVVVGHDCRFAGELFAATVSKVLCANNIKVILAKGFVSTPMISLAAHKLGCDIGIIITASHNPPSYNGFKLKGSYGGPLIPSQVSEIEDLIEDSYNKDLDSVSIDSLIENGSVEVVDIESMYIKHVEENFDLEAIKSSGIRLGYDAMYGAGQNVMRKILPDSEFLHSDYNPSFMGQAPEPIHKNLLEFSELIKKSGNIDCGLATDGDADRLGFYDSNGNFVDSHHLMLLIVHYLHKYKGMNGKICVAFSATPKVAKLCEHYGLEIETVKIGFKHICEIMLKEDVLMGVEESGGIAIKGHIPERDGIWMGLVIL
jgi:phosphomannomutase